MASPAVAAGGSARSGNKVMRRLLTILGAAAALFATLPANAQQVNQAANRAYAAGDHDEARRLWQEGCDGGNPGDCYELGIVYRDGEGVPADRARYLELIGTACDGDIAAACHNLAREELRELEDAGKPVSAQQLERGLAFYDRACSLGYQAACANLSRHRAREAAASGDGAEEQLASLRQDCLDGSGPACFSLASLFDIHLGADVRDDPDAANEALALGCERLDYDSCQNLAWHYDHGFGLDRDSVRSAALYQLACNDDAGFECMFVPRSAYQSPLYRGDEVLDQWRMAAGAYVRACDDGLAMGCFAMARLIAKSGNGLSHAAKVRSYLERALAITPGLPIAVELLRRLDAGEMPREPVL